LEAGVGVHDQHVGALLGGFRPHPPLLVDVEADIEAAKLHQRGALAGAEFDAAIGDEIERCDAFGDAGGMIVFRRHQADAVAEPDALGALRARREEDFRRGGVRIFLEEMVLDFPGVVDAELVGELDLLEGFLQQAVFGTVVPRPRQLMLVENAELHECFLARIRKKWAPVLRSEYAQTRSRVNWLIKIVSLYAGRRKALGSKKNLDRKKQRRASLRAV